MPQASILGPLGFIIYVNDIPNSVPELSLILYADDTTAFTSNKDISLLNNIIIIIIIIIAFIIQGSSFSDKALLF